MARLEIVIPADLAVIRAVTEGVVPLLRDKPGVIGHEVGIELALREADGGREFRMRKRHRR